MNTDPISAATHYRAQLEAITQSRSHHEAVRRAQKALEITFAAPSYDEIEVASGLGLNTGQPFVSLAVSNPVVQLPVGKAREIGLQLLGAAGEAESDGFVMSWLEGVSELSLPQRAALLQEFRAYREKLKGEGGRTNDEG